MLSYQRVDLWILRMQKVTANLTKWSCNQTGHFDPQILRRVPRQWWATNQLLWEHPHLIPVLGIPRNDGMTMTSWYHIVALDSLKAARVPKFARNGWDTLFPLAGFWLGFPHCDRIQFLNIVAGQADPNANQLCDNLDEITSPCCRFYSHLWSFTVKSLFPWNGTNVYPTISSLNNQLMGVGRPLSNRGLAMFRVPLFVWGMVNNKFCWD